MQTLNAAGRGAPKTKGNIPCSTPLTNPDHNSLFEQLDGGTEVS
jgi:hypothetical protein